MMPNYSVNFTQKFYRYVHDMSHPCKAHTTQTEVRVKIKSKASFVASPARKLATSW